jgi:purine-nucleoside phosphorylase
VTFRPARRAAGGPVGLPASFDLDEALRTVRRRTNLVPKIALVLGSGLGVLAQGVAWEATVPTREIPGIPPSTVPGHEGRLLLGRWAGRAVVVAQGRSHLYEGYSAEQVTRIVRLFQALGARALVLTNASGGISPRMTPGTLMLVEDQVDLQWSPPERGPGAPLGPRGLGTRPVYSDEILVKATRAAVVAGVRVERGVLGVVLGPSYETPSEVSLLERMGADAVCMSTGAEAATAGAIGLPVGAVSCVTNRAAGKSAARLNHAEVTAAVAAAAPALRSLLERLILALA